MQNLKRKIRKIKVKLLINQQFLSNFDKNNRLEPKKHSFLKANKRHLRADVLSLLSSALRPRLLSFVLAVLIVVCSVPVYADNSEDYNPNTNPVDSSATSGTSPDGMKTETSTSSSGTATLDEVKKTDKKTGGTSSASADISLTLSVPSDPLSLELQPNSTFTKSSSSSVSVKTDAFAGYSLSIKAKNNNELVNGESKLTSILQNLSEEQYQGEGNINTWGYQPSKFNSLNNTLFLPGPTTNPSIIESTKTANSDAANNYEFTLGAKADATINQGAYQNTFVFSVTANTVPYKITYELNSGTWNGTSPQTGNTAESTIPLDSNTPTKSGYEFKGWCPQQTSNETCGTTSYQPGNSYPLQNNDNDVTLWAMWKSVGWQYKINYSSNFSPTNMPSNQSGIAQTSASSYTVALASNRPSATGKTFKGWCTSGIQYGAYSHGDPNCSGTLYQPGNIVTINSNSATLYLYALWEYTPVLTNCTVGGRSGKRLNGGKCWMWSDYGTYAWKSAQSVCPSGWTLPSKTDFQGDLLESSGGGSYLYNNGWTGNYCTTWTQDYSSGTQCGNFSVATTEAYTHGGNSACSSTCKVRCVAP